MVKPPQSKLALLVASAGFFLITLDVLIVNVALNQISRELGNLVALAISLDNQASIHLALGDLDHAMAVNREGEQIAKQTGNDGLLAQILINQALIWYARRASSRAILMAEEAYRLAANSGLPGLREMIEAKLQYLRHNARV